MPSTLTGLRYHPHAYQFIFAALRHTQQVLGRDAEAEQESVDSHISGAELLAGIREFALDQFGLLARTVFNGWGVHATEDFGHIVFELVERGEMRKTEHDHIHDFVDVYNFEDAFDRAYQIDCSTAFERHF